MKRARFIGWAAVLVLAFSFEIADAWAEPPGGGNKSSTVAGLKQLSLEELADIKVTTESKQPVKLSQSPAAIYVITGDDIRRSGVRPLPTPYAAPGVEVARIDANQWAVGNRGFETRLSRSVRFCLSEFQ